ncbi:hypothetical protein DFH08DRAFT_820892 [Mycena albidolilacea]|uniref:Cytochrome P450 n=1 Tax=Mycena albidolilacea TaxID=1033008 RepID=A0AAD6ZB43_9AGAR|nr:hypothetical protein DFH08DRAFT_820892 [Mycena albidolilacea]
MSDEDWDAIKLVWEWPFLFKGVPSDRPLSDGRPVHRPVQSSVMREPPPPYRRRTVHWTAVFGTVRRPGRTVTIPTSGNGVATEFSVFETSRRMKMLGSCQISSGMTCPPPPSQISTLFHTHFIGWIVDGYATYLFIYRVVLYPLFFSPLRNVPGASLSNVNPLLELAITSQSYKRRVVSPTADGPVSKFLRDVLGLVAGHGLLTTTGEDHKQLRKAMTPAFSVSNLMAQTDMYYQPGLLEIMKAEIKKEAIPEAGTVFPMYEWMGKVALDIWDTAFGYKTDCLHNPHNELVVAFEQLLQLQSGPNLAKLFAILSIPGTSSLSRSQWMYRNRWLIGKLPIIHAFEKLRDAALQDRRPVDDTTTKKDIMSLLVRARKADLDADPTAEAMSDTAMVDQDISDEVVQYLHVFMVSDLHVTSAS